MTTIETLAICVSQDVPYIAEDDSERIRTWVRARNRLARSHLAWIALSAPCDLIVSRPARLSINVALRCAAACHVVSDNWCRRCCSSQPTTTMTANAVTTGIASQGDRKTSTPTKSAAKGRSISAVTVEAAMKSRTCSKPRRLAANEPTDSGRCSSRRPSTRSISAAESWTSMRALASSTKRLRSERIHQSAHSTSPMPMASAQSVSTAWLGTTRS